MAEFGAGVGYCAAVSGSGVVSLREMAVDAVLEGVSKEDWRQPGALPLELVEMLEEERAAQAHEWAVKCGVCGGSGPEWGWRRVVCEPAKVVVVDGEARPSRKAIAVHGRCLGRVMSGEVSVLGTNWVVERRD